jgi:hypothetical protein
LARVLYFFIAFWLGIDKGARGGFDRRKILFRRAALGGARSRNSGGSVEQSTKFLRKGKDGYYTRTKGAAADGFGLDSGGLGRSRCRRGEPRRRPGRGDPGDADGGRVRRGGLFALCRPESAGRGRGQEVGRDSDRRRSADREVQRRPARRAAVLAPAPAVSLPEHRRGNTLYQHPGSRPAQPQRVQFSPAGNVAGLGAGEKRNRRGLSVCTGVSRWVWAAFDIAAPPAPDAAFNHRWHAARPNRGDPKAGTLAGR